MAEQEQSTKQYGLKDPKKTKTFQRPAIFNSDSESGEDEKPTGVTVLKKKERIAQQKAVEEDPTIYQYDELYDDMQNQRKESKLARKDLEKKPKYINKLLESAERRKRENERRIERQVQKERDEEGDMFKDKESFVTSAYKKKLEELKELEEKEKREDYLESIGDVRKQGDLSGFYRHLYAQKVNFEEEEIKQEKLKDIEKILEAERKNIPEKADIPEESSTTSKKTSMKRKYRKRNETKSGSDSETEKPKMEHLPSNIDADSDFSIDSGSSDHESDTEDAPSKKSKKTEEVEVQKDVQETKIKVEETEPEEKPEITEEKVPEVPKKPKIDIWKKRTVGPLFDEALKRFYERKAAKIQSV